MSKATAPDFDYKEFDERLVALRILTDELAAIIGRDAVVIDKWRAGRGKPDADARVLLRVLDDDHVAALAVQRVRDGFIRDMRGDGFEYAGIDGAPAYGGGHTGKTGGRQE